MRSLKLIVGGSALAGVVSAATSPVITAVSTKCKGTEMTPEWYFDLIYCGLDAGSTTLTRSTLLTCVDALTDPAEAPELTTLLGSTSDPCATCSVTFANGIRALRSDADFQTYCVDDSTWVSSASETDVVSIACLNVLYEPISAFNECTGNGYDIVTAAATTRCSTDEFVGFEKDFRPWSSMVYQAVVEEATLSKYAGNISAGFKTALADLACDSCFADLYAELTNLSSSDKTKCAANARSASCLTATVAMRNSFALCTGGHAIHTTVDKRCTAAEGVLFDQVHRPYKAYVACAKETTTTAFTNCVDALNGLEETPSSSCDGCYDDLKSGIVSHWVSTCTTRPHDSGCVDALNIKDGPLREFAVCTGFEMNYESTQCTTTEIAALTAKDLSYAPMLIQAKYASDQFAAGIMIESALTDLQTSINGKTCESCFQAFVSDAYQNINNVTNTMDCANPYTAGCATSIADITSRFTTCSGATLTNASANLCTTTEYAALVTADLPKELLALALEAETATAMITGLDALLTTSPCKLCFSELGRSIVALSAADKLVCANTASAACATALAVPLATFKACSGSEFVATTIPEATTTTAAPTTTKSAQLSAIGVLFVSSVFFICL